MSSQMSVVSMPAAASSNAVSREPCRSGRVSSANTLKSSPLGFVSEVHRRGGGAHAAGGQGTGVAVGQHAAGVHRQAVDEPEPVLADGPAHRRVFLVNLLRHPQQRLGRRRHDPLHAIDRPEQVDRRRPAGREVLAAFGESALLAGLFVPLGDDAAERRRDPDRRCAADAELLDGVPHVLHRAAVEVGRHGGELGLIQQPEVTGRGVADPFDVADAEHQSFPFRLADAANRPASAPWCEAGYCTGGGAPPPPGVSSTPESTMATFHALKPAWTRMLGQRLPVRS